jgi:uncharacterized protein (DUF608 family)
MSTKARGSETRNKQKSDKIVDRIKRKRSLDEKTENKRGKVETVEDDLDESVVVLDESRREEMADKNRRKDLATDLILVMSDPNVMDMLSKDFAKKIIEDMTKKIEEVPERVTETEKRGDTFDARIVKFEQ